MVSRHARLNPPVVQVRSSQVGGAVTPTHPCGANAGYNRDSETGTETERKKEGLTGGLAKKAS